MVMPRSALSAAFDYQEDDMVHVAKALHDGLLDKLRVENAKMAGRLVEQELRDRVKSIQFESAEVKEYVKSEMEAIRKEVTDRMLDMQKTLLAAVEGLADAIKSAPQTNLTLSPQINVPETKVVVQEKQINLRPQFNVPPSSVVVNEKQINLQPQFTVPQASVIINEKDITLSPQFNVPEIKLQMPNRKTIVQKDIVYDQQGLPARVIEQTSETTEGDK